MHHVSKHGHYEAGVPVVKVKKLRQVCISGRRVLAMICIIRCVSRFDQTNIYVHQPGYH